MTAITVFNGLFCDSDPVVENVLEITGYRLVTDQEIIAAAARLSGLSERRLARALSCGDTAPDDRSGRERAIAWLRLAVAERLAGEQDIVLWGYAALLPPVGIDNILRVCLVSGMPERLAKAVRERKISERKARELIQSDDRARADWTIAVTDRNDHWATPLYDMVIPVGATGIRGSARFIVEQLASGAVQDTDEARERLDDFLLASRVRTTLFGLGYDLVATARQRAVRLSFVDHDKTLRTATRQLAEFVAALDGVRYVEIGVGSRYDQVDVYDRVQQPEPMVNRRSHMPRYITLKPSASEPAGEHSEDIELAACIQSTLQRKGYDVSVHACDGVVSLIVNNHKKMLEAVGRSIADLVSILEGVKSVEVGIGKGYHQVAACLQARRRISRSLMANDSRGEALFLSDRLRSHNDIGFFAVYDVKAASEEFDNAEPGVIVLDMPDMDDAPVLQRFKQAHPGTEVLILAGRESERGREACLNLGAFAFLRKPVNSAVLNHTIRAASEKHRSCPTP